MSSRLSSNQAQKLRKLIEDAGANVPFYAQRFAALDLRAGAFDIDSDFARIPELAKAELLQAAPQQLLNRRFRARDLTEESTTGSTGQPFTQRMERAYLHKRNLRFLRGLIAAGYRPWHRIMLLTEISHTARRYAGKWLYSPINRPADEIAVDFNAHRPAVLYGCTTPLRLLAEHLKTTGGSYPRPGLVVTTAEMLDPATRALLNEVFGAPVRDFYGLTEMGLVARQARGQDHYILERNSILTELIPVDRQSGRCRMLMTNLDLHAAPLIRFDAGDIAVLQNGEITGFEGRELDVLTAQDGSRISPYQVTIQLQSVPGIRRFKLTETDQGTFVLLVEAKTADQAAIASESRQRLTHLLGDQIQLDVKFAERIVADGTRKFRPVESRLMAARQ